MADLAARLRTRAAQQGLTVPDDLVTRLAAYFDLLQHWNRKINLTSISDPDEAVDRLLLEPIAAAKYLPPAAALADFGSGGGSPAIPLALTIGATEVLMVESRSRKAAFLREAVREVQLNAGVEAARLEDVSRQSRYVGRFDVVSIRALRPDQGTLSASARVLRPTGMVALFVVSDVRKPSLTLPTDLAWTATHPLLTSTGSELAVLFHVEHP
jgi:16S rRNA (guanine527-N7)-methyltransferase